MFPKAIVTKANGNTVDISTILPSKVNLASIRRTPSHQVEPAGRSGVDFLDVDGVVGKTMQSGSLSWKELEMLEPLTPCGRSSKDRIPRYNLTVFNFKYENFVSELWSSNRKK